MKPCRWTSQLALFTLCGAALAAAVILASGGPSEAELRALDEQGFRSYLDERIGHLMEDLGVPGVGLLVLREGAPAWSAAYGYADRDRQRPLTTDTLMMAHSISKSLTAWGVMKLAQEGRIDLDDPVVRHVGPWRFPPSPFPQEDVTVRRLLSLSAGLPLGPIGVHYEPGQTIPPLQEALTGDAVRLVRAPGSAFSYSNTSFALLELLVQEVTGRDFAAYMETEVLRPLGMETASFAWNDAWRDTIPRGYDLGGEAIPPYLYPYRASGGLFATLGDLGRFAAASMPRADSPAGGTVLDPAYVTELHTPRISIPGMFGVVADAYGLGHFIETLPGGATAAWHGGQGLGWMTHFHVVPSTGDGIVLLTNSQRSWPLFAAVLNDWARWAGLGQVGMGRIAAATTGVRILVGMLVLLALWIALRVAFGLRAGTRRPTFRGGRRPVVRVAALLLGTTVLATLVWANLQDYLFLRSIFPDESLWLGWSLLALALALFAAALVPVRKPAITGSASPAA